MKILKESAKIRAPLFILFFTVIVGYAWGFTIQKYRPILRNPEVAPFYIMEAFMHVVVFTFLWFQRDYLTGKIINLRKLFCLHAIIAFDLVHWFEYLVIYLK